MGVFVLGLSADEQRWTQMRKKGVGVFTLGLSTDGGDGEDWFKKGGG